MKKRRRRIMIGIIAAVIVIGAAAALLIHQTIGGKKNVYSVESDGSSLPQIAFQVASQPVNPLTGYLEDMDITTMRDTITPLAEDGKLKVNLIGESNPIQSLYYEVYSLDGGTLYFSKETDERNGDSVTLDLQDFYQEEMPEEAVLKITAKLPDDETTITYYTRIKSQADLSLKECLAFAQNLHSVALNKKNSEEWDDRLEDEEEGDNGTLQTVNIYSNINQVKWGNLTPQLVSDVSWSIQESNTVYTSLLARYQVACEGDSGEEETFNIKEFFRVRCIEGEMYLLNYNRTMDQVFNGKDQVLDEDGILLGITDPDEVDFVTNAKETAVAFVSGNALWVYDTKTNELANVYSLVNEEGDVLPGSDQYQIQLINMEDNGSTTFAVYGYMNQGSHKGEVGIDVCYFDMEENQVEEEAFIESQRSFLIMEHEFGKTIFYNHQQDLLYVLIDDTLYEIDLSHSKQNVLAEDLAEGEYVESSDGQLLAYQTDEGDISVISLSGDEPYTVEAREGEIVRPLGFVGDDLVLGYAREDDAGSMVTGEEVMPVYELEIRNSEEEPIKVYAQEGIYIEDIIIEDNLVTLNRLIREGDIYSATSQDSITNNEDRETSHVAVERYYTNLKERQYMISFSDGLKNIVPQVLNPQMVAPEKMVQLSLDIGEVEEYYVYGYGELVGIYEKAADAIQEAQDFYGVVTSSDQAYVWESGNRDLLFSTGAEPFQKTKGQTSLDACLDYMDQYDAKRMDLTGCSISQILYVMDIGMPVIAMIDSDHAVLLTGYNTYNLQDIIYMDPDTGAEVEVTIDTMEEMIAGSGNMLFGYVK